MAPHTTKVPAEKKLINNDNPPMNQGTDSPPAKNDFRFLPVLEKLIPTSMMKTEKITTTAVSIMI
ncbi:hypothetical protein D3C86_2164290 [compost metagenome]